MFLSVLWCLSKFHKTWKMSFYKNDITFFKENQAIEKVVRKYFHRNAFWVLMVFYLFLLIIMTRYCKLWSLRSIESMYTNSKKMSFWQIITNIFDYLTNLSHKKKKRVCVYIHYTLLWCNYGFNFRQKKKKTKKKTILILILKEMSKRNVSDFICIYEKIKNLYVFLPWETRVHEDENALDLRKMYLEKCKKHAQAEKREEEIRPFSVKK